MNTIFIEEIFTSDGVTEKTHSKVMKTTKEKKTIYTNK